MRFCVQSKKNVLKTRKQFAQFQPLSDNPVSFSLIYPEYGMKVQVNFEISNNGYGRGTDQVEALTRYLPHKKVCNAGCHFHWQKGKGNILLSY